ncbi:MAG: hypothetical protein HC921_16215 [Synechococcaceae cyanobacterium SM2_3_1]|nr:hypothetical protein [Synechococcaceae cyanobacterium SM2_3_1]
MPSKARPLPIPNPTGVTVHVIVHCNLQVDNSTAIREAVLSGMGIAVCPFTLFIMEDKK